MNKNQENRAILKILRKMIKCVDRTIDRVDMIILLNVSKRINEIQKIVETKKAELVNQFHLTAISKGGSGDDEV